MIDRNHPAVTQCFPDGNVDGRIVMAEMFAEIIQKALEHLTADDLPTRLVRDIQARTIRAAARAATCEEDGIPWDHDWDRATVSTWLGELADELERDGEA